MPSFILIHPTVWPQCTNVTDRQTDKTGRQDRQTGQRTDSIGRTVLQTVAQKPLTEATVCILASYSLYITLFLSVQVALTLAYICHRLLCPQERWRSIVMRTSVCVRVCLSARISLEPHVQSLPIFLCMLPVAVAWSSSGRAMIPLGKEQFWGETKQRIVK